MCVCVCVCVCLCVCVCVCVCVGYTPNKILISTHLAYTQLTVRSSVNMSDTYFIQ